MDLVNRRDGRIMFACLQKGHFLHSRSSLSLLHCNAFLFSPSTERIGTIMSFCNFFMSNSLSIGDAKGQTC